MSALYLHSATIFNQEVDTRIHCRKVYVEPAKLYLSRYAMLSSLPSQFGQPRIDSALFHSKSFAFS